MPAVTPDVARASAPVEASVASPLTLTGVVGTVPPAPVRYTCPPVVPADSEEPALTVCQLLSPRKKVVLLAVPVALSAFTLTELVASLVPLRPPVLAFIAVTISLPAAELMVGLG